MPKNNSYIHLLLVRYLNITASQPHMGIIEWDCEVRLHSVEIMS